MSATTCLMRAAGQDLGGPDDPGRLRLDLALPAWGKQVLERVADQWEDGSMKDLLERISIDPKVCHGRPCIRGTRIMVWQIVSFLAAGDSIEDIVAEYPQITFEDVQACLAYAAEMTKERVLPIEVAS